MAHEDWTGFANATTETHVLLPEPAGTLNPGNVRTEKTVENPDRI